jgi:hypothetical protein
LKLPIVWILEFGFWYLKVNGGRKSKSHD